jgi:hypothetical protein
LDSQNSLENLAKIGQLKQEPPDKAEINGLIASAREKLNDVANNKLSFSSQFDLTYNAAHSLALAALRFQGYRSNKRYLVFQCLAHTTNLSKAKWRVFGFCHDRRNLAEYEGHLEVDEQLQTEFLKLSQELLEIVSKLEK